MANSRLRFDGLKEWTEWFHQVTQPETLLQLVAVAAAAVVAFWLVWILRKNFIDEADVNGDDTRRHSVFFGSKNIDGVLFPFFWLLLVYTYSILFPVQARYSIFQVAIPLLMALLIIRVGVKLLRAAFEEARWVRVLEQTVSWAVWLSAVLWMSGFLDIVVEQLDHLRFNLGSSKISVFTLLQSLVVVGLSILLALWLSSLLESRLLRKVSGATLSLRKIISGLIRAIMLFIAILIGLSATGIDLTALSVFSGAIGVGIGLGLQKLASNYVSGFVILAERTVKIGDYIRVDGFEGKVTNITARYTVIRALTGTEAILPNEVLITQRVENNSLADRCVWVSTTVSVGYDSDVALVQKLLLEAALKQPRVLRTPAPAANLENFGADGLDFRLGFWIADPENGTGGLRSDINKQILDALRSHHIDIPYPQRVVHHVMPDAASATASGQPQDSSVQTEQPPSAAAPQQACAVKAAAGGK